MEKTLVLVYNFPHQIMGVRARQLFHDLEPKKIVYRSSGNLGDTIRFVLEVLKYSPKIIYAFDIGIPTYFAALLAKILSFGKTKVVVDTGDLVYLFSKAENKYGKFTLEIIRIFEDALINLADRMVVRAPYHMTY